QSFKLLSSAGVFSKEGLDTWKSDLN
ncbi:hypothetical protein EVA_10856, partial [gut metagenome]